MLAGSRWISTSSKVGFAKLRGVCPLAPADTALRVDDECIDDDVGSLRCCVLRSQHRDHDRVRSGSQTGIGLEHLPTVGQWRAVTDGVSERNFIRLRKQLVDNKFAEFRGKGSAARYSVTDAGRAALPDECDEFVAEEGAA
jgi:hypothetical protein